jgi:hypothetical protein
VSVPSRTKRIAAVAATIFFAALLIWLYGVKVTLIWAAGMSAFLLVLWAATVPMRRRRDRFLRELGVDRHGRPLAEVEEEDEDDDLEEDVP